MNNRNFEEWLSTFRKSIEGFGQYENFLQVYSNIEKFKLEIELLNSLVGSKNIERDFENLLARYPECLKVIPILLAVRAEEIFCCDTNYRFDEPKHSVEQYKYFMRATGLFELLENHIVANLYDYVTGVEVGLDSNGRKNRGGHQMENLVERFLHEAGVTYHKEMYLAEVEKIFGLDMSAISAAGTSTKRFDFVVEAANKIFGIETNFYTGGGSKLNETARSYKLIAEESRNIAGFEFVWITDGNGWKSARRNLKETFLVLDMLYNIRDLEDGIFLELFNE
ncbi:MAG: type II restriction endonuclease [Selenomonadaceae bacterium]|nr:type II restriction endonuclease [Selenomonadaceae bacterium]